MHSVYTQIGVPFFSVRLGALEIRVNRCARALGLHVNQRPRVLMYAWEDTSLGTSWGPLFTCKSKCPCALFTRKSVSPPSEASWDPLNTCKSMCSCALFTRKSVSPRANVCLGGYISRHVLGPLVYV